MESRALEGLWQPLAESNDLECVSSEQDITDAAARVTAVEVPLSDKEEKEVESGKSANTDATRHGVRKEKRKDGKGIQKAALRGK